MKVFIDTSAWVGLLLKSESAHADAVERYTYYQQHRAVFFSSHYIFDELFTRLLYTSHGRSLKKIWDKLQEAVSAHELTLLTVDESVFARSGTMFLKYQDQRISFTDATTAVLCADTGMTEVFTFDRDFIRMGLRSSPTSG